MAMDMYEVTIAEGLQKLRADSKPQAIARTPNGQIYSNLSKAK